MLAGRESELAFLNTQYNRMLAGNGSVLFLTGEAGLGKTTLVHSWISGIRDQGLGTSNSSNVSRSKTDPWPLTPDPLFLESACSIPIGNIDVGKLEALQPWVDIMAGLSASRHQRSKTTNDKSQQPAAESRKLDLKKLVRDAAPAWAWALPFVDGIAHAAFETARLVKEQRGVQETNPNAANQQQVFQQYVNLLTKIAVDHPLVIFLDDLHWADTSSCNLLFYLSRQISEKKILVIATYREDDALTAHDGKGHPIITVKNEILRYKSGNELALSYLSEQAIEAILQASFPSVSSTKPTPSAKKFIAWLHKISDGNSLFATQFIETLKEDGHLDASGAFVGDYASITTPQSALAVVEERTRRLDEGTRKLLTYATAEGEEFTSYILERLTKRNPLELLEELQKAAQHGLIRQMGNTRAFANTTTALFGFSHALFHKALYDQLLDAQKDYLHRQCFELLNSEWVRLTQTKTRTTTLGTKLLTHAEQCGEWETVANVALETAREYWRNYNEDEALTMVEKILDASGRLDGALNKHRGEALTLRGSIAQVRGRNSEAIADHRAAETVFRSIPDGIRAVDMVNELAWTYHRIGSLDDALHESTRALDEARNIGYQRGEALALTLLGNVHDDRGHYSLALDSHTQSLAMFASLADTTGEARAVGSIGNVLHHKGEYESALEHHLRALKLCQDSGNRLGESSSLMNIGNVHTDRGDYGQALRYYGQSLEIKEAIGNLAGVASTLNNVGNVYIGMNEGDRAMVFYERCLQIYESLGNAVAAANAMLNIGGVYGDRGEHERALALCNRSLEVFTSNGNLPGEGLALSSIGSILRQCKRYADSRLRLERALTIGSEIGNLYIKGCALGALGVLDEEEARSTSGEERKLLLKRAVHQLDACVQIGRETQSNGVMTFEKDLIRIRELLNNS